MICRFQFAKFGFRPQYASSEIKVDQTVQIALKEFPDRTFTGKVARTSVALDPKARTLRVKIHVPNNDLTLAPGMYADVNFSIPRINKMYLIPTALLQILGLKIQARKRRVSPVVAIFR
jgi:multidrug efflux pump subunit AcrA (membrane-fusion protein)